MRGVAAAPAKEQRSRPERGVIGYWLIAAIVVAGTCTLVQHLTAMARPFNGPHAWVSADFALQARSFSHSGVIALRGIPFANNPPFGIHKEPYLHWPPLFPILLSFVFRIFGESEVSMHAFMIAVQIATALCIYLTIRSCLGSMEAAFGLLAWLSRVVVLKYSGSVFQINLAILFMMLSVLFFRFSAEQPDRRRLWFAAAAAAVFIGVLSSWEAVLAPAGLLVGSLWIKDRVQRRIAFTMLGSGTLAAISVLGWYALMYPDVAADTLNTIAYRTGLGNLHSTDLIYHLDQRASYPYLPLPLRVTSIAQFLLTGLGGLSLLAIGAFICVHLDRFTEPRRDRTIPVFAGLLAPPLIWFTLLSNHAANHEYQYLLAAPVAAFAIAWCAGACLRFLAGAPPERTRVTLRAFSAGVPLLLLFPIVSATASAITSRAAFMAPDTLVEFGRAIRNATPPGAVVLTPELSEVPIYYSQRHVIAGVVSDEDTRQVLPIARTNFPGAPLYLAIYREGRAVILKLAR